jgi:hypothetical protein
MWWARHTACIGRIEVHKEIWWENLRERDNYEEPGVNGIIILELIFKN